MTTSKSISTFALAAALSLVACGDETSNHSAVDAGSTADLGGIDASTVDAAVAIDASAADATVVIDASADDAAVAIDASAADATVALDAAEPDAAEPDAATALPSVCPTSLYALPNWFMANDESNLCGYASVEMSFIVSNPNNYTVNGAQVWVVKQIGSGDPVYDGDDGEVVATTTVEPITGAYTINVSADLSGLSACELDARRFLVVRVTTNETGTARPEDAPLYEVSRVTCAVPAIL